MQDDTTKSVLVEKYGSYDALSVKEFGLPPLDGLIEVEVEYGGLNFADLYTRQGLMRDRKPPFVLGMECSGVITNIGVKDAKFKTGDRVICYDYKGGMYRQKIRVTPDKIYAIPDELNFEDATAILVNYLTAYFSVFELGHLQENQSVLILSCAGGVGWAATQLCKSVKGVKVIGTVSAGKEDDAKKNGVDETLPLDKNFEAQIKNIAPSGVDLIICNQSGSVFSFLQTILRPLGRIIALGVNNIIQDDRKLSTFSLLGLWFNSIHVTLESLIINNRAVAGLHLGTLVEKDEDKVKVTLDKIFKLYRDGKIKPKIHSIHPMENIAEATKLLGQRKNIGKVLIKMKSDVKVETN